MQPVTGSVPASVRARTSASAVAACSVSVQAICTHLGCTPRYLATEDKYKCPCHGSGYRGFASGWKVNATNFEGPAPRPMERVKIVLADDGQILVDKSVTFRIEKGEYDKPGAFLPYA